jgi:hypothetical protein
LLYRLPCEPLAFYLVEWRVAVLVASTEDRIEKELPQILGDLFLFA